MQVVPLNRIPPLPFLDRTMAHLVSEIGAFGFDRCLFDILRKLTGCEHVSVFSFGAANRPIEVLAHSREDSSDARQCATHYVESFWRQDPINDLVQNASTCDIVCILMDAAEIETTDYRYRCYTHVNLHSRLTLSHGDSRNRIRLNLYRRAKGEFTQSSIDALLSRSQLLMAAVRRHAEVSVPAAAPMVEIDFEERLRQRAPSLTQRENQVCALIARGLTSEGVALKLGISLNTGLTYRKRAYGRLGISSQNELMRLLIS